MPRGPHSLTSIDQERKEAVCAICGPVRIRYKSNGAGRSKVAKCAESVRASKGAERRESRPNRRSRHHGLRADERRALIDGAVCAICGAPAEHVDHCHRFGNVRGVLCRSCNVGIGYFADDPVRLEAAAAYLRMTAAPALS